MSICILKKNTIAAKCIQQQRKGGFTLQHIYQEKNINLSAIRHLDFVLLSLLLLLLRARCPCSGSSSRCGGGRHRYGGRVVIARRGRRDRALAAARGGRDRGDAEPRSSRRNRYWRPRCRCRISTSTSSNCSSSSGRSSDSSNIIIASGAPPVSPLARRPGAGRLDALHRVRVLELHLVNLDLVTSPHPHRGLPNHHHVVFRNRGREPVFRLAWGPAEVGRARRVTCMYMSRRQKKKKRKGGKEG